MITLQLFQQQGSFQLDLNVSLPSRGITLIFGRSGAGKTTLLQAISGLIKPQKGAIKINDTTIFDSQKAVCLPPEQRHIGYVFQDIRLFPHLTVQRNLIYGQPTPDKEHLHSISTLLGIGDLIERYPSSLSGGEQQRVAIGRALLSKPKLLLMDEPLSALDTPKKQELLPYIEALSQKVQIPVIYVSHNINDVLHLAEYIVFMEDGSVVIDGQPDDVLSSEKVSHFLSSKDLSS